MATKAQLAALEQLRGLAQPPPARPVSPQRDVSPVVAQPVAPPVEAEAVPAPRAKGGRPAADTEQISLRPPKPWLALLRRMAAEASLAEGRTVTPQMVILRLLEPAIRAEMERRANG
jgi:hypothetical protein